MPDHTDHPLDFMDGHVDDRAELVRAASEILSRPLADPVDHPDHYTAGGIECIDALAAALTDEQFAGFCRGNALKYLWRAGRKGDVVEDLRKASWYVDREIGARS